jgi:hypothetical protein
MDEPTNKRYKEPVELDALTLRRLAEMAASARGPVGDPYYFVQREDGTLELVHGEPGGPVPLNAIIEIDTRTQQPHRRRVTNVALTVEGKTVSLEEQFDAVFCTEAAVEKFVFPYLASESLWNAGYTVAALAQAWYGRIPPTSFSSAEDDPIPFAIGHSPNSEFTPLDSVPGAEHRLHLLFRDGDRVYTRPLAQVIREREEKDRGTAGHGPRTPASPGGA